MSRIGRLPVPLPPKVKASINGATVHVEGPKGKVQKSFSTLVSIKMENNAVIVSPLAETRLANAMHGTARSIIAGMVKGVVEGYTKNLEINGTGFKANLNGRILNLALGYSHPIDYPVPEGITVSVDNNTKIKVEGVDKHLVGQVAADLKHFYPVEPYKGKGVRIVGEHVRRKEGKKAG